MGAPHGGAKGARQGHQQAERGDCCHASHTKAVLSPIIVIRDEALAAGLPRKEEADTEQMMLFFLIELSRVNLPPCFLVNCLCQAGLEVEGRYTG